MSDDKREISFTISDEDHTQFKRLDAFLGYYCDNISRTVIKKYFQEGRISSSVKLELKKLPPAGNTIIIKLPPVKDSELLAQEIPLEILFEDEFLIIINKQAGLVVHPAPGNPDGTLVNAILFHCKDLKGIGDEKRPGIVHRLDKDTSGVFIMAKHRESAQLLTSLFRLRKIHKTYLAICHGELLKDSGEWKNDLTRYEKDKLITEKARTIYKVLDKNSICSLVEMKPITGRKHQLRKQLYLIGNPIFGDEKYKFRNN